MGEDEELFDGATPEVVNSAPPPPLVVRPIRGTWQFRRNCWLGVVDGALVANDRRNRRHEFALDGSDVAPRSHRIVIGWPEPSEFHFIDGRGETVVVITDGTDWDVNKTAEVGEVAGLVFDSTQAAPPLRVDCIKLEDSTWAEMRYIEVALGAGTGIFALGKFEVLDVFPWALVAVGLLAYCTAALFSGRYFGSRPEPVKGRRAPAQPGERNSRKRRKRRLRRRG